MDALACALAAELAEPVARRVAELLRDEGHGASSPPLVTAHELARLLNVDRSWVYEHRDELGGIPLGEGKRPRWRFDPNRALAARQHREPHTQPEPERTTPRRRTTTSSAPLLPITGRKAA